MNKTQLVDFIAKDAELTKADAARAVDAFTKAVTKTLTKGDSVTLVGFGTFAVSERAARKGRNPKTGEEIKIKKAKVAKFRPGKLLKESVNKKKK